LIIFGELSILRLDNRTDKLQSLDSLYDELEQVVNPENKWFQLRLQSEILEEMIKIELNNYSVEYSKDDHQSTILEEKIAEGIKIKEKINDQEGLCQMFIFKGDYMLKNNNNSIAEKSYQKALNIAKVVGSMDYASDSHTGLGKILSDKGKYDEALTKFTKAMVESKIDDNIPNQYASLIGVFSVAKELKDKNIVVEFSDETVAIFQKDKSKGVQYNQLISALKECSDFAPQITNLIP
jgi:tetratricopeptide (TPR) repeat protein